MVTDNLNVLFPFSKEGFAGSNVSAIIIANELAKRRMVSFHVYVQYAEHLSKYKVKIHSAENIFCAQSSTPTRWRFFKKIIALLGLANSLISAMSFLSSNRHISIVHTQDSTTLLIWWLPCLLLRRTLLWHVRCITRNNWKYRFLMSLPKGLLFVSDLDLFYRTLSRKSSPQKLLLYPPNVVQECFNHQRRQQPKKCLRLIQIGCVGPRKRLSFSLDIFSALVESGADVNLTLVGLNKCQEGILSNYSLRVKEKVTVINWTNDPSPYLIDADVLLQPSKEEAFGRVQIEALANGVFILAAQSQASFSVINSEEFLGRIVLSENVHDWTGAICDIMKSGYLNTESRLSRTLAAKEYLIEKHISKLEDFYRSISL